MGVGRPGTFQGMLAFQQRKASDRCCKIVRALFCLIPKMQTETRNIRNAIHEILVMPHSPSGIMSRMSCMTDARSSRSKCDSTLCLVTVFATPFEWRPSNCLERRFPSHLSKSGVTPLMKKSQTRQPGAQNPHPGPLPTGPCENRKM